jgi:hypothetical protein
MFHQPNNARITTNEKLIVKVGDTFKCECSIRQRDSDESIWNLNSWKLDADGWYHLGSTNGKIIIENVSNHSQFEWTKQNVIIPSHNVKEVVQFT